MTHDPHEDLVRALRDADAPRDPGDAFFRDQARAIAEQVAQRPAPRRSLWARLSAQPRRWLLPATGLAAAACAALLLVWWIGRAPVAPTAPATGDLAAVKPTLRPTPKRPVAPGAQWLARHAPARGLRAVPRSALPGLMEELQGSAPVGLLAADDDEDEWLPGDDPATDLLDQLSDAELRTVEQRLRRELPGTPKNNAPPMRRPG